MNSSSPDTDRPRVQRRSWSLPGAETSEFRRSREKITDVDGGKRGRPERARRRHPDPFSPERYCSDPSREKDQDGSFHQIRSRYKEDRWLQGSEELPVTEEEASRRHGYRYRHHRRHHSPLHSHSGRERDRERETHHVRHEAHSRHVASAMPNPAHTYASRNIKRHVRLPFGVRPLTRGDLETLAPLFAHYLDLQKGLKINYLFGAELRGRWKSFVRKWNRGALAEGWYDPGMYQRLESERVEYRVILQEQRDEEDKVAGRPEGARETRSRGTELNQEGLDKGESYDEEAKGGDDDDDEVDEVDDDDDEVDEVDDYVPILPPSHHPHGVTIPTLDDLSERRALFADDAAETAASLRAARKSHARQQRELLEELVPRAEPGTRERRLEKRAAVNEKMRSFREPSPGGPEVAERELMGSGDAADEYRREKKREQRKKTERELRREEVVRARAVEREERVKAHREKEDRTMGMLIELARQRFG